MSEDRQLIRQLNDSLAAVRTELVRVRDFERRMYAETMGGVDELGYIKSGNFAQVAALHQGPVVMTYLLIYVSSGTCILHINNRAGQGATGLSAEPERIPLPVGITSLRGRFIMQSMGERPAIFDPSASNTEIYLRAMGFAATSNAQPV